MDNIQYYSNSNFDRGVHLRDSGRQPIPGENAQIIPIWREKFFFIRDTDLLLPITTIPDELYLNANLVFLLGLDNGREIFGADLSNLELSFIEELLHYTALRDLRNAVHEIANDHAALLAYAKGIVQWNKAHAYCGTCGKPMELMQQGHCRKCPNPSCSTLVFPRIDPAIIVLIEHNPKDGPSECLLNRRETDFGHMCSTFAGFVEIGESLEDAVKREMKEEVDVEISHLSYVASQPWPFPSSIMLGFTAEVNSKYFAVDNKEIKDAKWYTAKEIIRLVEKKELQLSKSDSIARYLIETWVEKNAK